MDLIKENIPSFKPLTVSAGLLSNDGFVISGHRGGVFEIEGEVQLLVDMRGANERFDLQLELGAAASLSLVELLDGGARSGLKISMQRDSRLRYSCLQLGSAVLDVEIEMDGEGAEVQADVLQLITDGEHSKTNLRVAHNAAHCTSNSNSKCLAAGRSVGEFHAIVYVAEGAQRTEAYQNSRNVALDKETKIIAEPQLEIYADDVKCSHGATVGQMNSDAIFYMRQRGLSEEQARKLQLLGYVTEIVARLPIENLREAVEQLAEQRLNSL